MKKLSIPALLLGGALLPGTALADNAFQGFGNDVPLSFAVKQIVPPNHDVYFGSAVDINTKVSWSGGGPWDQVLARTLEESALVAEVVQGNVVISARSKGNLSYSKAKGYPRNTEVLRSPGMVVRPYTTVTDEPDPSAPTRNLDRSNLHKVPDQNHDDDMGRVYSEHRNEAPHRDDPQNYHHDRQEQSDYVDPFSSVNRSIPGYYPTHTAQNHYSRQESHHPDRHMSNPQQPPARTEGHGYHVDDHTSEYNEGPEVNDAPLRVSSPSEQEWVVTSGLTLQELLSDWTESAGWSLVWDSPYEYPIEADAVFYGPFITHDTSGESLEGAAVDLVHSMSNARPPVNADFYLQNRVMVMTTSIEEHD